MKTIHFTVTLEEATAIIGTMGNARIHPEHREFHDELLRRLALQLALQSSLKEMQDAAESVTRKVTAYEFPDVIGGDE